MSKNKALTPRFNLRWRLLRALAILLVAGCAKNMAMQDRFSPEGQTAEFRDQRMMREPVPGAVAQDDVVDPKGPDAQVPSEITYALLRRGRERYEIHCTPCHDRTGRGEGIVVSRGFPKPAPLTSAQTRSLSDRDIEKIVSDGDKTMAGYRRMITAADRWAIVAYIRALQLSRRMPAQDLSAEDLQHLARGGR